ncbi:Rha family transcriptional regulator [Aeromonas veronii]|uniref:Rha family transcriptional regulator n=1 Tax=Aeromonas veronii TaxID=654 RepID=UPI0018F274A6|nr:Rha family transcriptional regulator [Aeromonas veronii]MBJ7582971.1 Rha family transcriptional regulator [Aeromonas veronii]
MTTSLIVAEAFGKRHDNVLRKLESLECSQEFNALNFEAVEYLDGKGELRRAWNMTKDGFIFLVMGFTGKQAASIKEAYINAFNWMADQLAKPAPTTKAKNKTKALPGGLTVEQQTSIKALVKARVELLPPEKQAKAAITCWSALKSKFGMTYKQIDPDHFADAVSLVARIPLEGELMPKEIATPLEIHYPLDDWMLANARVMGTQMGQGACIPSSALIGGDTKSAINALLTELERHKYEVSACRAELRAMKHHLESYQLTLDDIADSAIRIKRRIWREHH